MQLNYLTAFLILAASTVQAAAVAYDATPEPFVEKRANCGCGGNQALGAWGCDSTYPDGTRRCMGEWNRCIQWTQPNGWSELKCCSPCSAQCPC